MQTFQTTKATRECNGSPKVKENRLTSRPKRASERETDF